MIHPKIKCFVFRDKSRSAKEGDWFVVERRTGGAFPRGPMAYTKKEVVEYAKAFIRKNGVNKTLKRILEYPDVLSFPIFGGGSPT